MDRIKVFPAHATNEDRELQSNSLECVCNHFLNMYPHWELVTIIRVCEHEDTDEFQFVFDTKGEPV